MTIYVVTLATLRGEKVAEYAIETDLEREPVSQDSQAEELGLEIMKDAREHDARDA